MGSIALVFKFIISLNQYFHSQIIMKMKNSKSEAELLKTLEKEAAESRLTLTFLIKLKNGSSGIGAVLHCLEEEEGKLMHIETRQNNDQEMFMASVEETQGSWTCCSRSSWSRRGSSSWCNRSRTANMFSLSVWWNVDKQFPRVAGFPATCLTWTSVATLSQSLSLSLT